MESEDHLYLTLPSSASLDLYPDNKISDFKTELLNTIQLDRTKYEAGLSEIILDAGIENVPKPKGGFTIYRNVDFVKKNFKESDYEGFTPAKIKRKNFYYETIYIPRGLYNSLGEILRYFNKYLLESRICYDLFFSIQKLSGETVEIVSLKSDLATDLRDSNIFYFRALPWFKNCVRTESINKDGFYKFNEETFLYNLRRYIPSNTEFLEIKATALYFMCEPGKLMEDPGMAYVYSDIIDHQYVGNTKASLLRVVHFAKGERVITFANIHYLPISKTCLKSIRIYIRDVEGNRYPFTRGTALCKVHIRKKLQ